MTTPNQNSGRAGERILDTATTLFAQFGYHGVSTRDIANKAGVNEVTIYRHYRRKRDLYCTVLETAFRRVQLRGDLLSLVAQAPDARAAMDRTFELISSILKQEPNLIRLVNFSALELADDITPLLKKHMTELIQVLAKYLEPWMAGGDLPTADPRAIVVMMALTVCSGYSFSRILSKEFSEQQGVLCDYRWYFGMKS